MKNNKGCTLIELLVVVLIIGILAAIALPQYFKAVARSRASEALMITKNVKDAAERFALAHNGTYPTTFDPLDITVQAATNVYNYAIENGAVTATAVDRNHGVDLTYTFGEDVTAPTCEDAGDDNTCEGLGLA